MPQSRLIVFADAPTVDWGDLNLRSLQQQGVYRGLLEGEVKNLSGPSRAAEVLIVNKYPVGEEILAQCPELRLVCVAATGANNIDLGAARCRGVAVCNVSGYSTPTVAEHTLLLLLACSHRFVEHHSAVRDGEWCRSPHFSLLGFRFSDLAGKRLGILGYGHIGRRVARLAKAFGMQVNAARLPGRKYRRGETRLPLRQLLQQSDFVSLHCPLTPQTRHLLDERALAWMKPGAYLVNLARGALVDERALAGALKRGRLAGYASDVLSAEPPPPTHPLLQPDLQQKVILTPHIAWASRESRQRLVDEIAKNIAAFYRGKRRNRLV